MSITPFNPYMKKLWILVLFIFITGCKDGGGGTIYTDLCKTKHPNNCEVIPEDQQRGGPITNDDDIPPYEEENSFYTSFDLETKINEANPGSTVLIDKNVIIRNPVIVSKEITLMNDPSTPNVEITVLESSSAFFLTTDNFSLKNVNINVDNSFSLIEGNTNGNGDPTFSNVMIDSVFIKILGIGRVFISGENTTVKNSSILGLADVRLDDTNMVEFKGDGLSLLGNIIADVNNNYRSAVFMQGYAQVLINSNLIKGHASEGLTATVALSLMDDVSIENNILQDSNTNRQNIENDPDDEVNNSAVVGILQSNNIRDNNKPNFYNSYRFLVSDLVVDPPPSTNINFGPQNDLSGLFFSSDIFNANFDLKCDFSNNPAIYSSNDDNNLTEIGTSGFYFAGDPRKAPNCP